MEGVCGWPCPLFILAEAKPVPAILFLVCLHPYCGSALAKFFIAEGQIFSGQTAQRGSDYFVARDFGSQAAWLKRLALHCSTVFAALFSNCNYCLYIVLEYSKHLKYIIFLQSFH